MTQAPIQRRRSARRRVGTPAGAGLTAGARLFGRYRLEQAIGRGGSAEVWRAHDERLDRTVAIKVLHPHLLPDGPSTDRFVAEARAAAGLTHPAIVPVFDVVDDPATPAIVFRYVDGETLANRIARVGPMPVPDAVAIAADLAGALAHAHRVGLVHRDVKPGNVLIDADGRAQLVDFGIARALEGAEDGHTSPGDVVGTLRYMAPEQLAGRPVDARTDLYALGLVLHELLAGTPAWTATSPAGLVDAQRDGPPPPPAGAPVPLVSLLAELLAADPSDRPADADLVEGRLRAFAESPAPGPAPPVAGVAAAAPADIADPVDDARGAEADTVAFAAPPTIAMAVPISATAANTAAPARPAPPAPPVPRGRRATRVPSPGSLAIGGTLAAIGALALAVVVLGGGLGGTPAGVTRAGAAASDQLTAPPATSQPTAPAAVKPARGHGHGKHGGGGN